MLLFIQCDIHQEWVEIPEIQRRKSRPSWLQVWNHLQNIWINLLDLLYPSVLSRGFAWALLKFTEISSLSHVVTARLETCATSLFYYLMALQLRKIELFPRGNDKRIRVVRCIVKFLISYCCWFHFMFRDDLIKRSFKSLISNLPNCLIWKLLYHLIQ